MQEEKKSIMEKPVSRRDFTRIAMTFGITSTLMAWSGFAKAGVSPSAQTLAQKAESIQKDRYKAAPKYKLRYGAADHSLETTWVAKIGTIEFINELEERTGGAVRVEHLGSGTMCGEMTCAEKCTQGIIDFYLASNNNASVTCQYLLTLDWGSLWQNRAQMYNFAFDYRRERLLQEPMRRLYNIEMLHGDYGLRSLFMSKKKYAKRADVTTLDQLKKLRAKVRTTGTRFGLKSLQMMKINPVAISYDEVVDAVRQGAIDGADAWEIPFSVIHFTEYTAQQLYLKYCAGCWITGMNRKKLKALPSNIQNAIMEAAYLTQVNILGKEEASIATRAGSGDTLPPPIGSEHWKHNVRNVVWTDAEYDKLEKAISPKYQPKAWAEDMKRMNQLMGKGDNFNEMYKIAREVPRHAVAIDVMPKRWWKKNPEWYVKGVWKRGSGDFVKNTKKKA